MVGSKLGRSSEVACVVEGEVKLKVKVTLMGQPYNSLLFRENSPRIRALSL